MNFKEALDNILKELPPKKVDLERPTEDNLVLIFKGVQQHNGEGGNCMFIMALLLGLLLFFTGFIMVLEKTLEHSFPSVQGLLFLMIGGGVCWWGIKRLIQAGSSSSYNYRRWLEFHLTEKGGELYECITGKEMEVSTYFEWEELTNILLERQRRIQGEEEKHPYCIHLQSNQYRDTYLFEWEALGQEVSYCANVLRALCLVQQTGVFPDNWNQPPKEEPPFTDLSNHLIED